MSVKDTPKKVFVVTPRFGLCNQLLSITKGIVYAHIYGRDVYFDGFQNDYRYSSVLSPFDSIFNVDKINKELAEININVRILKYIPTEKIESIDPIDIPNNQKLYHIKDIVSILNLGKYKKMNYLCIENPISSNIPETYILLEKNLNKHIHFHQAFHTKVELIKEKLNLNEYCCIHMRLENDAIEYSFKVLLLIVRNTNSTVIHTSKCK